MFVQTLLPPVAGELFRFSVSGCAGKTNIVVYVNEQRVLHRELNELLCKMTVMIPGGTGGETLSIDAIDASGACKTLEYEISETPPLARSMLAARR
jgi:hypothetical protein